MTEIEIWYGDSNIKPAGPIKGLLIEYNPGGRSKIEITDKGWLDSMGWNEQYFYTCNHLPEDYYVSYDDYAWAYPGECKLNNRWW